jgi:DNA repair protein RadC
MGIPKINPMKNNLHTIHEMELVYLPNYKIAEKPIIKSSNSAYELLMQIYNANTIRCQEEFIVMYLNNNGSVLGIQKLSKGGLSGTVADIRLILATALKALATGIIISHNHPSGNLKPSENDKKLTEKFNIACNQFEIKILDHVIVTPEDGYFSFADEFLL